MAAYWLKMIGEATMPCPDPYILPFADFTRNPRRVRPGDHLILYAVGGFKTVFAVAKVTSSVKQSGVQQWPFRVNLEYEVNLKPSDGVPISDAELLKHLPAIQFGHSHLSLSEEEFQHAAAKLRATARQRIRS
jgi:hypothetical protein